MFKSTTDINIDLLWDRIYDYTDYGNLDRKGKMYVDKIYADLFDDFQYTHFRNEYLCNINNVFDYESTSIEDLRANLGNWLIDNKLNLVFTNLYGGHENFRYRLLNLHLFVEYNIRNISFLQNFDNNRISDIYLGMHYGIFLSGAIEKNDITEQPISIGSRYFLLNKEINQDRLTRHFELDVMIYERKDAKRDLEKLVNTYYDNSYYNGTGDSPKPVLAKKEDKSFFR